MARRTAIPKVEAEPGSQLRNRMRGGQVVEGLLHRHHRTMLPRIVDTPPEQPPDRTGEDPAATVVLQRDLARLDAQPVRRVGLVHLLDALQLDEVVAGTDGPEPEARQLDEQPRELTSRAVDAAMGVKIQAASLLDSIEVGGFDAVPFGGEAGAIEGAPRNLFHDRSQ